MLTLDELKKTSGQFSDELEKINQSIDIEKTKEQLKNLEERTLSPDFWNDSESAQAVIGEMNELKEVVAGYERLMDIYETVDLTIELLQESEKVDLNEIEKLIHEFEQLNKSYTLKLLLNESYDKFNAIIEFHPGAGGTESQDWTEMLFRMYKRYCDKRGYDFKLLDYLDGEEAGIKSATVLVSGKYAYGYLKAESGVHRLVRISPFDSSGRRHTSFASVDILPELDENVEINIDEKDLKIETYRASGAGGQHVNKTDSAVRITHTPSGTIVQCQNERSQHKNKKMAMKILGSRLLEMQEEAQAEKLHELRSNHKEIAWGSQIRSYVFHPYNMIKDHRTGVEEGNVKKVMDGNLSVFIEGYLKEKGEGSSL